MTDDVLKAVEAEADTDGVMICLVPDEAAVKPLLDLDETTEPADEAHITLLYLGSTQDAGGQQGKNRILVGMHDFAVNSGYRGLDGRVNGFGVFINEDERVLWAAWDIPGIAEFRTRLVDYLTKHRATIRQDNHGFTPHQTLAYLGEGDEAVTLPQLPQNLPEKVIFGSITLSWGDEWQDVPLA